MAQDGERPCNIFTCSTDAVAPPARADYYREAVRQVYPGLAFDWPEERPIQARLKCISFEAARITEFGNTRAKINNRPGLHPSGRYHLVLHLAGNARYYHAGRDTIHRPGDMMLFNTDIGFEGEFPSGLRVLVWELPRELLVPLLSDLENAVGRLISGRQGLGAVLAEYALTVGREVTHTSAQERRTLLHHLCGLIALPLGATAPVREARYLSHRAVQRQRVLAYVETHFRDCRLSAARAACDLKLSRRWLYDLLDDEEVSFAARVSRRRIEECLKRLVDPAQDHLSITEIAFRCGFGDLSSFNRRFRAQCGMSPREFRRNRETISAGDAV